MVGMGSAEAIGMNMNLSEVELVLYSKTILCPPYSFWPFRHGDKSFSEFCQGLQDFARVGNRIPTLTGCCTIANSHIGKRDQAKDRFSIGSQRAIMPVLDFAIPTGATLLSTPTGMERHPG